MTQTQIARELQPVADRLRALVASAEAAVRESNQCDSWFLESESSCAALLGNAARLRGRVDDLDTAIITIGETKRTDRIPELVREFGADCDLIASEATGLLGEADALSWATYARGVVRDTVAALVAGVVVVGEAAGGVGGALVGGILDGLGPIGVLVVAGLIYLYATKGGR